MPSSVPAAVPPPDPAALASLKQSFDHVIDQVSKVIVGQEEIIKQIIVALCAGGHCLLEGPSGLAKTSLVRSLADSLDLSFKRIQFTADLMPHDITGWTVYTENSSGQRVPEFQPGPIFANIVLADEINRATPKTQSALLEAMQETKVSVMGREHPIEPPFHVLATQNPLGEDQGMYPLPIAQLDRFLFRLKITYPSFDDEIAIMKRAVGQEEAIITPVVHRLDLLNARRVVRSIEIPQPVFVFAARLVRSTRHQDPHAAILAKDLLLSGAGPRASVALIAAAQGRAALDGRSSVSVNDVRAIAIPVLTHRLELNFQGQAEGMQTDQLIAKLINQLDETSRR